MKSWLGLAVLVSLVAGASMRASAHEGQIHVMGTIKAVDARSITVETKDKKETVAEIDAATKIEKDGAVAKAQDLAVGQRVVVHARKGDKGLIAIVIKTGTSKTDGGPEHNHHDEHSEHKDHDEHKDHAK